MSHDWFDGLGSEAPRDPPARHAQRGRRFTFHGAFSSKEKAVAKERAVGGFIRTRTIRGHRRYVVLTPNT